MTAAPQPRLAGILAVLCTPFRDDGSVDELSLRRLVDHQIDWGVDGIVVFGLAGEVYKLADHERRTVLATVVQQANGAVPVIAGAEHSGLEAAASRAREAVQLGADGLMAYPPTFVKPNPGEIVDYYAALADAASVPVIIQDAPTWTGVPLPADLLVSLAGQSPYLRWVKVEAPPAAGKIRALAEAGMHVLGGYGALHLAEDLAAGIEAVMPGCALPGLYVDIWHRHLRGDAIGAFERYAQALPLLVFQMSSLDVFVAVQKFLLWRIGILSSPVLRRPGSPMEPGQERWLEFLLQHTELGQFLCVAPGRAADSGALKATALQCSDE